MAAKREKPTLPTDTDWPAETVTWKTDVRHAEVGAHAAVGGNTLVLQLEIARRNGR